MRKAAPAFCTIGLLAVSTLGCIRHEGQLALFLTSTDNTQQGVITAQQVNIDITSVEILEPQSGTFLSLSHGSQIHEVLGLVDRNSLLALADSLDEGSYQEVRLTLSAANSTVVDDRGRVQPLRVEPETITVPAFFTVIEDGSTNVILEIDLQASLKLRANGAWVLRPVIRQVADPNQR